MSKIVFLASGGGGSLKFIYHALKSLQVPVQIAGVIADRTCPALDFAEAKNIYSKTIQYNRKETEALRRELIQLKPDVIITNIHKIIDSETLALFPNKFINLHYSLLPAFGGIIGMETIEQAKHQNVGFIGGTCHLVNEAVDAGRILHQSCFDVNWEMDQNLVEIMFRSSSMTLLAGIFTVLGINTGLTNSMIINNKKTVFSRPLPFEGTFMNEEFWEKIAK